MVTQLHFVFFTCTRPLRPVGDDGPSTEIVMAYCLPGHVVAAGKSEEDAVRNLQTLVEVSMDQHGGSESWWRYTASKMSDADRHEYEKNIAGAILDLEPAKMADTKYMFYRRPGKVSHCQAS